MGKDYAFHIGVFQLFVLFVQRDYGKKQKNKSVARRFFTRDMHTILLCFFFLTPFFVFFFHSWRGILHFPSSIWQFSPIPQLQWLGGGNDVCFWRCMHVVQLST